MTPESRLSARCPVCGVVGSCCAVAPTGDIGREIVVGQNVRITNRDHFDYGGSAPFGGHVIKVYDEDREADVRFYDEGEDGGWGWATWTFPMADLEPAEAEVEDPNDV